MEFFNVLKSKKAEYVSFSAAFFCGILTHAFGLVNTLHNYDDIAQQPKGYGTGITSGRWLLSLMGDIAEWLGGNYNLPLVNGLLFIALIAVSAGFLVSVFGIDDPTLAALSGMLLAAFPAAFSTLAFRYTSVYYGVGILLAVLAAWVLHGCRFGLILSAVCMAGSLGIYQAYIPITIGIFVLLLLQKTLQGKSSLAALIRQGVYYCFALILGLCCYYLFLKITLWIYGTGLSDYQGIDQMGKLTLTDLPALIWEAFYTFCTFPIKNHYGLASMKLIKIAYVILIGTSAGMLGYILLKRVKKITLILFAALMCLVFPVAVNFVVIMCPESWIYTLMVYAFVLVGYVPVILYGCIPEQDGNSEKTGKLLFKTVALSLAILIGGYAYKTNVNYSALYFSNRQIENYLNSMIVQIRMEEGFDAEKKWAFIGEIEDPLLHDYWQYDMDIGGIEPTKWMLQRYSMGEWIRHYCGYTFPAARNEDILLLNETAAVKDMPCWPDAGSIQVIDDCVVIKCGDPYLANPN